jgi:hypothetical protein
MAQETNSESVDPEIEHLKQKTAEGAANLVGSILDNPEVQRIIKNALVKESMKQALLMSCLLIGILNLYGVAKQQLGFGWQVETAISTILVLIGLIYLIKNMFNGKKNGY